MDPGVLDSIPEAICRHVHIDRVPVNTLPKVPSDVVLKLTPVKRILAFDESARGGLLGANLACTDIDEGRAQGHQGYEAPGAGPSVPGHDGTSMAVRPLCALGEITISSSPVQIASSAPGGKLTSSHAAAVGEKE